jgi:hypothetical protein
LVEELQRRRYFQAGSIGYLAEFNAGSGVEQVSDHGDSEDFRSALMSIRKLISDKEPTFCNRIVGILYRAESSEDRRERLTSSQAEVKKARKEPAEAVLGTGSPESGWGISAGRTREKVLRQLINTQLFHGDDAPDEALPDMTEAEFADDDMNLVLLRHTAIELVITEYEFACWLRAFILDDQ